MNEITNPIPPVAIHQVSNNVTTYWDMAGIFGIGFVFGFLLFYTVRHTPNLNTDSLVAAIGAIGGATLLGMVDKYPHWIGPYGTGLLAGFIIYFVLAIYFEGDKKAGIMYKFGLDFKRSE